MKNFIFKKAFVTAAVLAGLATGGLGGCSFQPLHGPTASGNHLNDEMAAIQIAPIYGRIGQRLRNELIFKTTGGDYAAQPKYSLTIATRVSLLSVALRRTGDAGSRILSLRTTFTLSKLDGKATVLLKGKSATRAAFDKFDSTFANLRAQQDAENRAAKTAAEEIYNRVAAFISGNT